MTTVTTTPIDALEPLAPPALAQSGPPAGDFDLLIALWQSALATAPMGATVPDPSGAIAPDSSGTADVTTASAPSTAITSGRSTRRPGAVAPLPIESGGPHAAVVEPITEEQRDDDDENERGLQPPVAQLMVLTATPPVPAMAPPPAATFGPGVVEPPRQEGSATPVTRAVTDAADAAWSPRPTRVPSNGRVEVEPGVPRVDERVEPVGSASVFTVRALSMGPATDGTEALRVPVPGAGTTAAPVAAQARETESGVASSTVTLARPEATPLPPPSPSATAPSANALLMPDEQRPPLAAPTGPRALVFSSRGDVGADDSTAAETAARPSAGPLRRVPSVAGRDSAHEAFSRPSHDREGTVSGFTADATPAGPPAAAPPPERITADIVERIRPESARGVVDQITTPLREIRSPGRHEISVRLDPPELGAVRIDARLDGGRLHVVIRAEHAVTGDLLADRLPQLRESLAQQGFTPGDVSVGLGLDASGRQSTRDGAPAFTPSFDGIPSRPARAVPPPVRAAFVADGLDVWA